ncbi:MAG: hypothetical protein LBE78_06475 [Burkholderiaceae bacterium]|jgi:hypothetical protein|nr:hypothetical protein [Burkholderiaceae bacterium]
MRRPIIAVVALAGWCGQALAQTTEDALRVARRFNEMSIVDAGTAGRWVVWTHGAPADDRSVTLSLVGPRGHKSWSRTWAGGAYAPALRSLPQWRYAGAAVLALTVQFGAAAEEVHLFGLAKGRPVELFSELADTVGWIFAPGDLNDELVLLLYNTHPDSTTQVPSCYRWNDSEAKLAKRNCPSGLSR